MPRRSIMAAAITTIIPARTIGATTTMMTIAGDTGEAMDMPEPSSGRTYTAGQKRITQLDRAADVRGTTQSKTVSANHIADSENYDAVEVDGLA